jgi:hypothetical protein
MTRARNGAAAAAPVRSSRTEKRSEADMRSRYDTIKLRLPLGYKARLQRLAEEDGYSVADWVATMVEMAESEIAALRQRPPRRSA